MAPVKNALLFALLLTGCDSLVDARYQGPLQLKLVGEVIGDPAPLADDSAANRLRAALFYFADGLQNVQTIDGLVEAPDTAVLLHPPNSTELSIYDLPDAQQRVRTSTGVEWAFAVPYAYVDANSNALYDPGERVVGEAPISGVYFSAGAVPPEESPTGITLDTKGVLRLGSRPTWCQPRPPEPTQRTDCGVTIGATCTNDSECGSGVCLTDNPWPWPNGMCALPVTANCAPEGAHVWRNHRDPSLQYWLPACTADTDCRGEPYRCDEANAVCLPISNLYLRVDLPNRLPVCQP